MTEPTDTVPEPDVDSIRKRLDLTYAEEDARGNVAVNFETALQDVRTLLDALATAREEAEGWKTVSVDLGDVRNHVEYDEALATITQLRGELSAKDSRIDELEMMKARTWTSYEMEDAVWTFTFNIHRDDAEDVLAHELAHAVQRFRWGTDDPVHSEQHAAVADSIRAALSTVETPPELQSFADPIGIGGSGPVETPPEKP